MAGELTNLKEFSVSELSGVLKKYVEEGFSFIKVFSIFNQELIFM